MRSNFVVLALFLATAVPAKEYLYIHNTDSGTVSKIAIPEHEVVSTIDVGLQIDYLAKSPDNRVLYVNRIELIDPELGKWGDSGELIAFDTRTDEELWRVQLDGMPNHHTVSADGRYVYVPYFNDYWLAVVDTEQRAVVDKIFVGMGGHVTKLSPDGKRLYVGSMYWNHIAIVDLEKREMIERLNFPELVRPFEFTQDESRLYVQLSSLHGFVEVDRQTGERQTHLLPDPEGLAVPGERYPRTVNHGIELIKDETELWIVATAIDQLMVYSHPELELVTSIPVGSYPNAVTFDGDQRYAYTGNPRSNDVSVVDTATYREIARIPVGLYPQRMVVIDVPEN